VTIKKGLGRGLSALLKDDEVHFDNISRRDDEQRFLDIDLLKPGKYQPRQYFDDETLGELAESIKNNGLLQPIIVRIISRIVSHILI
jgi:ParB family chromosome partitioning protein